MCTKIHYRITGCQPKRFWKWLPRKWFGLYGWNWQPGHTAGIIPGIQTGGDRTGNERCPFPRSAPFLRSSFSEIRWRCKDCTGEFGPRNLRFHPRYLRSCDRKDEERQRWPDPDLHRVRKRIRENVRENKNPLLRFRTFWTSKVERIKRNPWIRKNPGWI